MTWGLMVPGIATIVVLRMTQSPMPGLVSVFLLVLVGAAAGTLFGGGAKGPDQVQRRFAAPIGAVLVLFAAAGGVQVAGTTMATGVDWWLLDALAALLLLCWGAYLCLCVLLHPKPSGRSEP